MSIVDTVLIYVSLYGAGGSVSLLSGVANVWADGSVSQYSTAVG